MITPNAVTPAADVPSRTARPVGLAPLLVGLAVLGVVLSVSVVPGVFIVDENNYLINLLALRQGRVTIANTEGLPPSRELLFFDPTSKSRVVNSTPVASTAPPLYAIIALPFSCLGWRGLVGLNTIAYLVTIYLVFTYTRRYSTDASTPWLAAIAFTFGGYGLEYSLGLWPHALSFMLCTGGIVAAGAMLENNHISYAAAAGFMLALATGVRYQNIVVVAAVGAGVMLLAARRRTMLTAFIVAAMLPLAANATFNHFRLDSWNPISKGPGYLSVPILSGRASRITDPLLTFWTHVVDFSTQPPLTGPDIDGWMRYDATTHTHLLLGVVAKKALLQSAPWAILPLLVFAAAWLPPVRMPQNRRTQVRLMSLVVGAIFAAFSFAGIRRYDGLSFNERYLLEVLPLAAIAFAWALDGRKFRIRSAAVGAAVGIGAALVILLGTPMVGGPENMAWVARQIAIMKLPLVLAGGLVVVWYLNTRGRRRVPLSLLAGACLGWGFMIHIGNDVLVSQAKRAGNLTRTRALAAVVPDSAALVGLWGFKDAAVPLLFTLDIVILDAWADEGKDAPVLIRELLSRNRRVFALEEGFSQGDLERVGAGFKSTTVRNSHLPMLELRLDSQ